MTKITLENVDGSLWRKLNCLKRLTNEVFDVLAKTEIVEHGHWIEIGKEEYECSECGFKASLNQTGEYCLECGSHLDGDVEHL